MSNISPLRLWSMRLVFVALALVILLGDLLPLQTVPRGWAGPDLLFCLALIWSVRAPDYVPVFLLATLFLLADFLLSRPPGLAAAMMLLACSNLQSWMSRNRDTGLTGEWLRATFLIFGVMIAYRLALVILFVPAPPLGLAVFQAFMTTLFYPAMIALSAFGFGVRFAVPGEYDRMGQRS